jgi:hypothetical protein
MLYKVLENFTATVIDQATPEGKQRSFRKMERIAGEKKEIHQNGVACNFVADDFLVIGVPLSAIAPDGKARS